MSISSVDPTCPTPRPIAQAIVPRDNLDFDLDGDIPRYWFGNDVFKTRFFDAMSVLFPEGERFFIACARDYRDQITGPRLLTDLRDFSRQEAQHGKVHGDFNKRLSAQGIKVDRIMASQRRFLFDLARRKLPKAYTLALTAASEHLTAVMSEDFVERRELFADADPRVRAMYTWHAMEEVEHKGVAFDVMKDVAQVGYGVRALALIIVSVQFPLFIFQILNHMLKVDGFSRWQRARIWAKGLWWLYKPGGLLTPLLKPYLAWYQPGFHPWKSGMLPSFPQWDRVMARTGNAVEAANALHQAPSGPSPLAATGNRSR